METLIQGAFALGTLFVIYNIPYIVDKLDALKKKLHS
jgi:hypothetical protein